MLKDNKLTSIDATFQGFCVCSKSKVQNCEYAAGIINTLRENGETGRLTTDCWRDERRRVVGLHGASVLTCDGRSLPSATSSNLPPTSFRRSKQMSCASEKLVEEVTMRGSTVAKTTIPVNKNVTSWFRPRTDSLSGEARSIRWHAVSNRRKNSSKAVMSKLFACGCWLAKREAAARWKQQQIITSLKRGQRTGFYT